MTESTIPHAAPAHLAIPTDLAKGGTAAITQALNGFVAEIVAAIRSRREIVGERFLALNGVASILFGVLLLARSGTGLLTLIWLIGASLIALAFRVRGPAADAPRGDGGACIIRRAGAARYREGRIP